MSVLLQRFHYTFLLVTILSVAACGGGGDGQPAGPPPPDPLYVRASGSDTNSGADPANALRSITRAAEIARSNYRIIVGPGTYTGGVTAARAGRAPQALQFIADAAGTQTGDRAASVIIQAASSSPSAGFSLSGMPGGVIDGFTIRGGGDAGIVLKSGSDNFTIQNCIVEDNPGNGIRVQDSRSVLVFNNLVVRSGGDGILIAGTGSGSPDARVYSNTMYGNGNRGLTVGNTQTASPRAFVYNNIIQQNGGDANVKVFTSPRSDLGYTGEYNLVFPPTYIPVTVKSRTDLDLDARFVDPTRSDFHLNLNSPAINQNSALPGLPNATAQILRQRSTTGAALDTGLLDLGYHFIFTR
jgi:parallel beta-helix repeat protein